MTRPTLVALFATCLLACGDGGPAPQPDDGPGPSASDAGPVAEPDGAPRDEWDTLLDQRERNYSTALRKAALRLVGQLPTLAEVKFVADAAEPRVAYEAIVDAYLEDPRFARQQVAFWQDSFRLGGSPVLDSAGILAAQIVVEGRPFSELLTATSGTCPSFDAATATFTPGECDNGVPAHAGLLTHPGVQAQFMSNMAFRRVRWVQETFDCTAFPAEAVEPQDVGGAVPYTAPWPLNSIAGYASGGAVDFLDVSAVACANCHATMNHVAPLFGNFDADGVYRDDVQVTNPTEGLPITQRGDWLPEGEVTAWRLGVPAADLPELGRAMAADPRVAACAVARVWNFALGRGDIVDALALVPHDIIADQLAAFRASNQNMNAVVRSVFTSDDFVTF